MSFSYFDGIPAANNNPSTDQPNMLTNTNSIDQLLAIDHFSFNVSNGGRHQQVQMPLRGGSPGTIPPSLVANEGTIYTKTANSNAANNETDLFYTPDVSGNQYQITRTVTAFIGQFGTSTNYPPNGGPAVTNQNGGWTFLPGGLLMQYGTMLSTGSSTVVTFPIQYTTALFSVTATRKQSSTTSYGIGSEGVSGFTFSSDSSSVGIRFYWMAIGV